MKNSFLGCGAWSEYAEECGRMTTARKHNEVYFCEKCQGKKEALDKVEANVKVRINKELYGNAIPLKILDEEVQKLREAE